MTEDDYDLIKRMCRKHLVKPLWERHLEDLEQYAALRWLECGGKCNLEWVVYDYLRINGYGERGKVGARALEHGISVGLSSDEDDDVSENGYLLDQKAVEIHKEEQQPEDEGPAKHKECILEEFLLPLNLKEETLRWAIRMYRYQ